jgi:predicted RNase H-like HicB family nuclease
MQRYEIMIYWNGEDQVFVAEVPELPGCMAHGGSIGVSGNRLIVAEK